MRQKASSFPRCCPGDPVREGTADHGASSYIFMHIFTLSVSPAESSSVQHCNRPSSQSVGGYMLHSLTPLSLSWCPHTHMHPFIQSISLRSTWSLSRTTRVLTVHLRAHSPEHDASPSWNARPILYVDSFLVYARPPLLYNDSSGSQ
jgi:hypothetical protein